MSMLGYYVSSSEQFLQASHLIIYILSIYFFVFLIDTIIVFLNGYKWIFILSSIQLCTRLFDLLWYNSFGFDSLISPLMSFIHFYSYDMDISIKQLNRKKSNINQI